MIKIGQIIYNSLAANTAITNLVGNKIYPLIAPENTTGSFIIYTRSYTNENNKDSYTGEITIELLIISIDYKNSIELAENCINTLTTLEGQNNDYYIFNCVNVSGSESYNENGYTQNLVFTIKASK